VCVKNIHCSRAVHFEYRSFLRCDPTCHNCEKVVGLAESKNTGTIVPVACPLRVRVGWECTGTPFPFVIQWEQCCHCFFLYTVFKLLTVIFHGCPLVIKLIYLLPAFMCVSDNDVTASSAAFRLCFKFYTPYTNIKTRAPNAPKMHHCQKIF